MDKHHPRESLVGKGYGLATDCTGTKGIVLSIGCLTRRAVKGEGGMSILGTVGNGTTESARVGLSLLRRYCPRIADTDLEIRLASVDDSISMSVSGASGGQALLSTMISALIGEPFDAEVCVTGMIDTEGRTGLVGGIQPKTGAAKLDTARLNGFKMCLIPKLAMEELKADFPDYLKINKEDGCETIGCKDWLDCARYVFSSVQDKAALLGRLLEA